MIKDLDGFVGHLDELVPGLMQDSIYGKDRLTKNVKSKNVGNISDGPDVQYLWWNSETQSNWRDGYIRNAVLLGDSVHLAKIRNYINNILSTQDKDGYFGIYAKDLRYNFKDENGELWAKATLLRGLLAWYEFSRETKMLAAVNRAVADVMKNYPPDKSSPFKSEKPFVGGLTHGLVFTDILDQLYHLTGDTSYLNYALFLYKDFSQNILNEDGQYDKIMDGEYKLKEHGVHTYEQLRPLTVAYFASGNDSLKNALDNYLDRIRKCTTPAGGPIGDEWIGGRTADATETGYEYCLIQELLDGYSLLLQKTGDPAYGDLIEKIFFNAAQGARHPEKSCIAYCKTDNSFEMTGTRNGITDGKDKQTRYKYSPSHQDVAVCCVPNAGRIMPYYIKAMWMKDYEGLVATILGPNELSTEVKGVKVRIIEETNYPIENTLNFKIIVNEPLRFTLKIRKPGWVKSYRINSEHKVEKEYIVIDRKWQREETLTLILNADVELKKDLKGWSYFTYGALVLSLPIESREIMTRKFTVPGFADFEYSSVNPVNYKFIPYPKAEIVTGKINMNSFWYSLTLKTSLFNQAKNKEESVILRPLGATILRQVTFESKSGLNKTQ